MRVKRIVLKREEREMQEPNNKKNLMKVALVQMQSQSSIEDNLIQASQFLEEAVFNHEAQLIVFPENFLCLGASNYSDVVDRIDICIKKLSVLAKMHSVYLLLGSVPVTSKDKKCFSRSILINSVGLIVGFYDKIHLFDVSVADQQGVYKESEVFDSGQIHSVLPVCDRQLGLSICYDLRFPELYQELRNDGAEMIAVPSAFTYKTGQVHWEILLRARAIETQCYVLAANQCGSHIVAKSSLVRETWGRSMIVNPWGDVLCSLDNAPGVCSASLDFDFMESVRQSMNLIEHKRR